MQGHIRKHGKGWALVLELGKQPRRTCLGCGHTQWLRDHRHDECTRCKGDLGPSKMKRRQRWETFRRKVDAEDARNRYLAEMSTGRDPFPMEVTVREYAEAWLARRDVRPKTLSRYRQLLRDHLLPDLGELHMDRVRPAEVQAALDAMSNAGQRPSSVRQARAVLRSMMKDALRSDLIYRNPVDATSAPAARRSEPEVPSSEEIRELLTHVRGTKWEVPLAIAALTGARRSEVLALTWQDVDLDSHSLAIRQTLQIRADVGPNGERVEIMPPKTDRSRRTILMPNELVEILRVHRRRQLERRLSLGEGWQENDLVCDRGDGSPFHPDSMSKAFKRLAGEVGMSGRVRLHDLRHSVAVAMSEANAPLAAVSAYLGHSSPTFTASVYQHFTSELSSIAVDALERRMARATGSGHR